jgi:hypothetical protein
MLKPPTGCCLPIPSFKHLRKEVERDAFILAPGDYYLSPRLPVEEEGGDKRIYKIYSMTIYG